MEHLTTWLDSNKKSPFPRAKHFDFFDGNATAYIRVGQRFHPELHMLQLTVTLATIDVLKQRQGHMHAIVHEIETWAQRNQAHVCVESVINPDLRASLHKMDYHDSPHDDLLMGDMWKI